MAIHGLRLIRTPVAVLGMAGAWHRWAPRYKFRHLEALVRRFAPDLLCAEIGRADWEAGRQRALSPEYRECLVPLCRKLGVTIVPVDNHWPGPPSPVRLALALGAGPRWLNSTLVDRWHRAWARLWPDATLANQAVVERILEAVQRDPGRRVLAAVRMERRFAVIDGLRGVDEVILLPSWPPPV